MNAMNEWVAEWNLANGLRADATELENARGREAGYAALTLKKTVEMIGSVEFANATVRTAATAIIAALDAAHEYDVNDRAADAMTDAYIAAAIAMTRALAEYLKVDDA